MKTKWKWRANTQTHTRRTRNEKYTKRWCNKMCIAYTECCNNPYLRCGYTHIITPRTQLMGSIQWLVFRNTTNFSFHSCAMENRNVSFYIWIDWIRLLAIKCISELNFFSLSFCSMFRSSGNLFFTKSDWRWRFMGVFWICWNIRDTRTHFRM